MLEVRDCTMRFPGVLALDSVSFRVDAGEVHGLVGENGAGKSTLLKIISGVQHPTEGHILWEEQPVRLNNVHDAEKLGIAMIHQELNLAESLSVAENILLGVEPTKGLVLDIYKVRKLARQAIEQVGADFSVDTPVEELSLAQKQRVEIAKAVYRGARLVIMDEPTAVLSDNETDALLALVKDLSQRGTAIIYVSHRLHEVAQICHRVTVLRDGQVVGTLENDPAKPVDTHTLAEKMVGRELSDMFPPKPLAGDEVVLSVEDLRVEGFPAPISLEVRQGEVVGLAGLVGSGRTEVAEAIAGLRPARGRVEGVTRTYVSEDRKGTGLFLELDVIENTTLANLSAYGGLLVDNSKRRLKTREWILKFNTKVADLTYPVINLSGGNQQKVSLAKSLDSNPGLLILDEPTRGVDVGAKAEIYRLIAELAAQGMSFLVISSELPEVLGLCSRIYVMRERQMVGEVSGGDLHEQGIMKLAAGVTA